MGTSVWFKCLLWGLYEYRLWTTPPWKKAKKSQCYISFTCGSAGKESTCNAGDLGSSHWVGRCPEEEKVYPFHILTWRIPCTSQWGHKELDTTEWLSLTFSTLYLPQMWITIHLHFMTFLHFLQDWLVWSPCCPKDSQESSPAS